MNLFSLSDWQTLFEPDNLTVIIQGFGITILVALSGLALALVLGVIFGMLSSSTSKLSRAFARVYVEFFQNTPLLILVRFLFVLPMIMPALIIPTIWVGILGVGVYHGAYVSEVVRAGIQSIHKGQLEAGLSQGFSYVGTMRYIIIPQALRVVLPPLTNQAVSLIKNTSALAVISGYDLMYAGKSVAGDTSVVGPTYFLVAVLYFALCYPLAVLSKKLEDKQEVS